MPQESSWPGWRREPHGGVRHDRSRRGGAQRPYRAHLFLLDLGADPNAAEAATPPCTPPRCAGTRRWRQRCWRAARTECTGGPRQPGPAQQPGLRAGARLGRRHRLLAGRPLRRTRHHAGVGRPRRRPAGRHGRPHNAADGGGRPSPAGTGTSREARRGRAARGGRRQGDRAGGETSTWRTRPEARPRTPLLDASTPSSGCWPADSAADLHLLNDRRQTPLAVARRARGRRRQHRRAAVSPRRNRGLRAADGVKDCLGGRGPLSERAQRRYRRRQRCTVAQPMRRGVSASVGAAVLARSSPCGMRHHDFLYS